jgi:hypothetical protein
MPAPETPEARNLHREAQVLMCDQVLGMNNERQCSYPLKTYSRTSKV